jgi:Cyclopropane fatty acid synthase and related methyltransferases
MSKPVSFWNNRFDTPDLVYGAEPNAFIRTAADTWLSGAQDVLDLGAGEGRNSVFLARRGHAVTAVDYAKEGLRKTRRLGDEADISIDTIEADVRDWIPERTWDAVVVTFLHLSPAEQPALYDRIQEYLVPGGFLLAEWFRPEQRTENYTSGGPPDPDMMVAPDELRGHFPATGIKRLDAEEPVLKEGMHQGLAATVRFVWRRPR